MAPRPITKPRCHNCRRKKIKCDYGRPKCSQCKRSNLQCEGYDRDLVFVSHNSEVNSPPPAATNSRVSRVSGVKKAATSPSSCSSSSSTHSSSPDPPAFTTIEFYHPPPPPPVRRRPAASPCKLLSNLNLFDISQIRGQFKPLDSAISAVLTASYTQPDACYPTQAQTIYSQALFELRQSKQRSNKRHDSWHSTAFTSLMLQLAEVIDGANVPIADWISHSNVIASMPPMSSIRQFGASDNLTLTFCRTAMLARDVFGGCEPLDLDAWYLQSWGEVTNDDLHRVLDVIALLPALIQRSNLIALNPYDVAVKFDFEQEHKRLSALVQGLYTSQTTRGDFATWVTHPYETLNSCSNSDIPCMSISACQRLAFIWLAQMLLFSTNEKVRCSMPLTPESMNQSIDGDIEWFLMLETVNNMQHVIAHCVAVDNSLVGVQAVIMPLRMLNQFATSYSLTETRDWCHHTVQGLVDQSCHFAPWSIPTTQTIPAL